MEQMDEQAVRSALETHPRVRLAHTPTPLDRLANLSGELGVDVHLKRDDLTGLALGGDKPRKLEYELARAQAEGADVIVTCGSAQSNHARLTTAAARVLGMDAAVVLGRDQYAQAQGNLLTVGILGAETHFVDATDPWELEQPCLQLCARLRAAGRRPYFIPVSGTTATSCLGYVRGGFELVDQLRDRDLALDALYTPFGTGGIFTAMLLALRASGSKTPLIGISVNSDRTTCLEHLQRWTTELTGVLGLDGIGDLGPYEIHDEFVGAGYGQVTEGCLDAILRFARSDGILLDPVYSGKMAAGFLAHCDKNRWEPDARVALLHSGGIPALFAYAAEISAHLDVRSAGHVS
jgi:1-aminocyclopropane-1-carboxylate deaminase/D-cysteine desulfhydrase-like pyridoxal-dependent ACC family enzyme